MLQHPGRRLVVTLLCVALAVVAPTIVVLSKSLYEFQPVLLDTIGVGLGYVGLAGVYLVLGRPGFWLRLPIAIALALMGGWVSANADRERAAIWGGASLFIALLVATPILYLWGRGLRLTHPDDPPPTTAVARRRQFSLWNALSATTSLAILFGVARYLMFPIDELRTVAALFAATACIAWIGAGMLLSRQPLPLAAAAMGGATLAAALWLPSFPLKLLTYGAQFQLALSVAWPMAVIVSAAMLAIRTAGYTLRWPTYEVPAQANEPAAESSTDGDILPLRPRSEAQSNHSSEASNLG